MKFSVGTTTDEDGKSLVVEFHSLEELLDFIEKAECPVIIYPPHVSVWDCWQIEIDNEEPFV